MATFADRLLVYLSKAANLDTFLKGMNLDAFFTKDFQTRFDSDFWQIAQVTVGQTRSVAFEQPVWTATRILGRKDHYASAHTKTEVDYRVYGTETTLWADAVLGLDTTWQVNQLPGTVVITKTEQPTFEGISSLVAVLRIDATNHPLDRSGTPLPNVTLNDQGQLHDTTAQPTELTLDPLAGVLLRPNGTIYASVLLAIFPLADSATLQLGAPLDEQGRLLHNLRMDNTGAFTDLSGKPVPSPLTQLVLDAAGKPVRPALLAVPGSSAVNYRFSFSLPVQTERVTFTFVTYLYLFIVSQFSLVDDLRNVLALRQKLEQRQNYLLNLDDTANRSPIAFALVYEDNALSGSGLARDDVLRLGASVGVLIHFFTLP